MNKHLEIVKFFIFISFQSLNSDSLYASQLVSVKELKSPQTYKKKFPQILLTAQKKPSLFLSPYEGAPMVLHILGSGIISVKDAQNLISVLLPGISINNVRSDDGRTMLHAIALSKSKNRDYQLEMFTFLLEKGMDSQIKDKAGLLAENYFTNNMNLFHKIKMKTDKVLNNLNQHEESSSITSDAHITKEQREAIIRALIDIFETKDITAK